MEILAAVWKEGKTFVAKEIFTNVVSQGNSIEDAIQNLKEAVELYLEEFPEMAEEMQKKNVEGVLNVKIAHSFRT